MRSERGHLELELLWLDVGEDMIVVCWTGTLAEEPAVICSSRAGAEPFVNTNVNKSQWQYLKITIKTRATPGLTRLSELP